MVVALKPSQQMGIDVAYSEFWESIIHGALAQLCFAKETHTKRNSQLITSGNSASARRRRGCAWPELTRAPLRTDHGQKNNKREWRWDSSFKFRQGKSRFRSRWNGRLSFTVEAGKGILFRTRYGDYLWNLQGCFGTGKRKSTPAA